MKYKIYKKEVIVAAVSLVLGLFIGWVLFHNSTNIQQQQEHAHNEQQGQIWTCSMHPQIKEDKPGDCPICGMDLVPLEQNNSEETTDPNEIRMSEAALSLANVQTTKVSKGAPNKEIRLLGKVKPDERNIAELTARYGGRIEKLFVNYKGQKIRKGEKLARIYSPDLITAQKELLEAVKFKESNPSYFKAAVSKLKLWDLSEKQIDNIISKSEPQLYFNVLSPITGTVTKRHVAQGDYVKEGSELFQIINLNQLWVMFDAYESDLAWVQKGDSIEFSIQSLAGEKFRGKISYIDPFIDPKTRVASLRVEIKNKDLKLKPEMFATGVLKSSIAKNTNKILIPKTSVLWTGKRSVVYVKVPNRETVSFKYRQITLGPEAGNFYVVADGLSEGEVIATNGVFKIDAAAQLAGKNSMMNPENEININEQHSQHTMDANLEHKSFKVSGNCSMCEDRIEKAALEMEGVNSADWNVDSKILHISFNHDKVTLDDIHKKIASVGHDTEKESAPKEVYDELPQCCKYSRE